MVMGGWGGLWHKSITFQDGEREGGVKTGERPVKLLMISSPHCNYLSLFTVLQSPPLRTRRKENMARGEDSLGEVSWGAFGCTRNANSKPRLSSLQGQGPEPDVDGRALRCRRPCPGLLPLPSGHGTAHSDSSSHRRSPWPVDIHPVTPSMTF